MSGDTRKKCCCTEPCPCYFTGDKYIRLSAGTHPEYCADLNSVPWGDHRLTMDFSSHWPDNDYCYGYAQYGNNYSSWGSRWSKWIYGSQYNHVIYFFVGRLWDNSLSDYVWSYKYQIGTMPAGGSYYTTVTQGIKTTGTRSTSPPPTCPTIITPSGWIQDSAIPWSCTNLNCRATVWLDTRTYTP